MSFYNRLMAKYYDAAIGATERRCFSPWRSQLLQQAEGDLLEVGAGTGLNLPHYPQQVERLILSEPDPYMRRRLQQKLPIHKQPAQITAWPAEKINLADGSLDTVVSTLVLCSVDSVQQSLQELFRVLKPGGQLLFLEHVIANDASTVRWQKFWEPLWKCACGNCHLTRDTVYKIEEMGMIIKDMTEETITGAPSIVRRAVIGRAQKPHSKA
ncbi:Methyltransferase domain-containing protein [Malonomonas rubra DSM 5091]|uniref:Methyltransferase domain-containing protein n=1 Tax=Malonomonas rubra DSM 5091 TaxID=1122189 RepID=A0A1M6HHY0_MALRU|nr:class I SAM-dependent methyltransferase [Malonomonas rubra]SHJ21765.1 Methyltransferase domain-containing protein [Malonomonas rubra DSM 5091]